MLRHFDEELNNLHTELLKLAILTETAIKNSIEALKERDQHLANTVLEEDTKIDELEVAIDEKCLDLIALRQPVAQDLRLITMIMKITVDLERIADLAVDIAERALVLMKEPLLKPLIDIPKLSILSQNMMRDSIDAFIKRDINKAKAVILKDNEADNLRNKVQKELVYDYIVKDGSCAPRAIPLLLVARHLERICDHATNIAEDVIYMIEGKIVKHHPENLE
jgi:phosphate transport system protein